MSSPSPAQSISPSPFRVLALLLSVTLSTSASLLAKYALTSFSPFTMTAIRIWIAALVMLPIALRTVPGGLSWRRFRRALPMSLCYGLNSTCFAVGISLTTAIAAQLVYMLVPVLTLIGARLFFGEFFTKAKVAGMALGMAGVLFVLLGSAQGQFSNSLGTPLGNAFILCAAVGWTAFTLLAQRQSQSQHPFELSCYALLTCAFLMPALIVPDLLRHQATHGSLTWLAIISAVLLALLVSVGRDLAFQWGIKGSSAFIANVLGFITPFLTAAYAIPLLGERLSSNLLISGGVILLGLFFAIILPARQQRRIHALTEADVTNTTADAASAPADEGSKAGG